MHGHSLIPAQRSFILHNVHTGSKTHQNPHPMGTWDLPVGVKPLSELKTFLDPVQILKTRGASFHAT